MRPDGAVCYVEGKNGGLGEKKAGTCSPGRDGSGESAMPPWPERSGPRGIGIHHAGAELEPAKGDSGVKR